ncbi:MAG: hypothetical protein M0Z99_28515 [Betaproteobacteria bacterium]|nr:hypothetical protein [Betaproteobacteria bacterium]
MASQPHKPTAETRSSVAALASFGVTSNEIAAHLGISQPTLRRHYRTELDTGAVAANAKVARALFNLATGGNVTAAIFWLKCRARWHEKDAANGAPPLVNICNALPV